MLSLLLTVTLHACSLNGGSAKLTVKNNSTRSVPVQIPGVMNPNFSPMSSSGVTLEEGQQVFFNYRGKRTLLFTICNEKNGDVIFIDEVVKRRTAELDRERNDSMPQDTSRR